MGCVPGDFDPENATRWFLRRGLTSLTDGTSAYRSTSRRAAPALAAIFVLVMLTSVPATSANLAAAVAIVVVAVLLTWVGGNLVRRSPPFSGVDRVGWGERVVFVVVPALSVLVTPHADLTVEGITYTAAQARYATAVTVLLGQVLILIVVLLLVRFGVVALTVWLAREVARSLSTSANGLARALPLLLALVTFSYFTGELWQAFGRLDSYAYLAPIAVFLGLSVAFLAQREHLDLDAMARFENADDWRAALAESHAPAPDGIPAWPAACPLTRQQRGNLRLVATLSRLVVAGLVGLSVFVVFLVLGTMIVDPALVKTWTGADPDVLATWSTARRTYVVCWENIRVCGFVAVFSGFYYAIVSATDPTLRRGLSDTAAHTVRGACALRLGLLSDR